MSDSDTVERWAVWPDGTMCPAEKVEALLRPPCAFSDDFQWVWVGFDADDGVLED